MWRALAHIENFLAVTALVLFSVFIVTSVFFRYVLDLPLSWTEEASLIAFSWLLFLGGAICARDNEHILIDLFSADPSSLAGRASEVFAALVGALVAAAMTFIGLRYAIGAAPMVTPIFRVSSAVYNAAAPVGFALITLHFLRHAASAMRPGGGARARRDS